MSMLSHRALGTLLVLLLMSLKLPAQTNLPPLNGPVPQAPPPAPPIQFRSGPLPGRQLPRPLGLTPYSIGQPTDEEQLYLEYLNRMRANPTAEGQRLASTTNPDVLSAYSFFGVDLNLMQYEFSTNPPAPPLAMNPDLIASARWHSGDMYTNQYQGHYQTNGSVVLDPGQRMTAEGYNWVMWGENVYAYADSVFHGHAGFAVDWGPGIGGMQNPAGHRQNMLNPAFREVGMGVVDGSNGPVGPQLVTQDFATAAGATPFITGVVYYDFNTNGFYDLGEGIGGVMVNSPQSPYYAITATSGGFALPVTSNGVYTVTFTAAGISNQVAITVAGLNNVKRDYVPLYTAPVISGPNPASLNQSNSYSFTPVGAATGYQWLQTEVIPYTYIEGAEHGLTNVTVVSSPGYSVLATDLKASGAYSFHLAHQTPSDQVLTLDPVLLLGTNSQLIFAKYLGYAFSNEVAHAEVSVNGGAWEDVWSQSGNNGATSVDSGFVNVTNSLAAFAGQSVQVRFLFSFSSGSYFPANSGVGLYLDNIAVSGASQLTTPITNNVVSGTSFAFLPTNTTSYVLQVRAELPGRILPWGKTALIGVTTAPPALQFASPPTLSGSQVQMEVTVASFPAGMSLQLWKASAPNGPWSQDTSATLQTVVPNSSFRFTTTTADANRTFYLVKGIY